MTPEEVRQRFSEIVEQETVELVAYKLGVSVSMVDGITKGRRNPGLNTACAICEVYDLKTEWWVTRPASRLLQLQQQVA